MKFSFDYRGQVQTVEVLSLATTLEVTINGELLRAEPGHAQPLWLQVGGQSVPVRWARDGRAIWLQLLGHTYLLRRSPGQHSAGPAGGAERSLSAPMPGQVRKVLVQPGETVAAGAVLVLLEAMKMEVRIVANQAAKVAQIAVSEGQNVDKEQILVELEPEDGG